MFYHRMTRRYRKDKGLVLVLVVALCATMAILGSTFLFIARSDRRRNENVEYRFQANTAAQNVVAQVRALLKEDLRFGRVIPTDPDKGTRPYGAIESDTTLSSEAKVTIFSDFPREDSAYGADLYLSTFEYMVDGSGNDIWPALTNLTGDEDTVSYANISIDHHKLRNVSGSRDSSGELLGEARLNQDGTLYIATRVVDLGGLINVNTSFQRTASFSQPAGQAMMGLLNLFAAAQSTSVPASPESWAYWANFNAARCDGNYQDPEAVQDNLAESLDAPGNDYNPFGINDESALRWLDDQGEVLSGRLWDYTMLEPDWRKHLTTYSVSRNITRYVLGEYDDDVKFTRFELPNTNKNINSSFLHKSAGKTYRTNLFKELADAGMDREEAAHFVANLWAYHHGQDADNAYNFEYDSNGDGSEDKTVYGMIRQPFIVEAYLIVAANTLTPPDNDSTWGYAIEVWNPYADDLEIYLGDKSDNFSDDDDDGDNITIEAGTRKVFYSWDKGDQASSALTAADIFVHNVDGSGNLPSDWVENGEVNFSTGKSVSIIRKGNRVGGGSDPNIVLDTVSGDDMGFTDDPKSVVEDREINLIRDDALSRHRYSIADCRDIQEDPGGNTLGAVNNLPASAIPYDQCFGGFDIPMPGAYINDLNELVRLFRTGPNDEGDSTTAQLSKFKTDASRGRMDVLGTPASGPYPAVPHACLIGEFFDCIESKGERYFGRLNINTATQTALEMLPWPTSGSIIISGVGEIYFEDSTSTAVDVVTPKQIAEALLEYRDGTDLSPYVDYSSRKAFKTPGEIASVLAEYMEAKFTRTKRALTGIPADELDALDKGQPNYLSARDMLYGYVSNLICTQSDVFAVYVHIQTNDSKDPEAKWQYLAVIDRSNCENEDDEPTLLLFTRLK